MDAPKFPTREVSETLIDFAQPLLARVDSKMPTEKIQLGFDIAVAIWNIFVLDRVNRNTDYQRIPAAGREACNRASLVTRMLGQ